ncbi:MAG: glycosyltransferase family 4 protein [Acetatifactor sp.]|nr:glycosyltransferase family 4 protein [Acetatifactor sp.]
MNKNIVFIINNVYVNGGIPRITLLLIENLIKTGKYNIALVSLSKSLEKSYYEIPEQCRVINLSLHTFSVRKHTLKAARELHCLFPSDFDGTFVVADVGHSIPAWLGLRHCMKAKFISWSHTNFFNGSRWGFSGWGKRLAVKKFDYLVALTKEDKGYYDKILHAANVVQIYNPINGGVVKSPYAVESKKIISCGRLDPVKGFDLLIGVAKKVFSQVEGWTWDIYGDGAEKESLEEKIKQYDLIGKVNLKGFRKDILSLYKEYAFNVFTSRGEGCPIAMIEAQSAGLPIISFDFKCGPKDLITDGENGFIVANWDLDEMADRILKLIEDKELRYKFAANADMNLGELKMPYVLEQWNKIL